MSSNGISKEKAASEAMSRGISQKTFFSRMKELTKSHEYGLYESRKCINGKRVYTYCIKVNLSDEEIRMKLLELKAPSTTTASEISSEFERFVSDQINDWKKAKIEFATKTKSNEEKLDNYCFKLYDVRLRKRETRKKQMEVVKRPNYEEAVDPGSLYNFISFFADEKYKTLIDNESFKDRIKSISKEFYHEVIDPIMKTDTGKNREISDINTIVYCESIEYNLRISRAIRSSYGSIEKFKKELVDCDDKYLEQIVKNRFGSVKRYEGLLEAGDVKTFEFFMSISREIINRTDVRVDSALKRLGFSIRDKYYDFLKLRDFDQLDEWIFANVRTLYENGMSSSELKKANCPNENIVRALGFQKSVRIGPTLFEKRTYISKSILEKLYLNGTIYDSKLVSKPLDISSIMREEGMI